MHLHGIVMKASLEPEPDGGDGVEMRLTVQGVGPGQPRRIVVPMTLLLEQPEVEPETVEGHAFEAEVTEASPGRWVADAIGFAGRRVLREE